MDGVLIKFQIDPTIKIVLLKWQPFHFCDCFLKNNEYIGIDRQTSIMIYFNLTAIIFFVNATSER